MKCSLHLISMPMVFPLQPSIQIGELHAHLKNKFADEIDIFSYSAYWDVLFQYKGGQLVDYYLKYRFISEDLFFLVCNMDFPVFEDTEFLIKRFNKKVGHELSVSIDELLLLRNALVSWIKKKLIPNLKQDSINVIGFTTTFAQVFASIFVARFLETNYPDIKRIFVFGGASIMVPEADQTLKNWQVKGCLVRGPGEVALEQILSEIRKAESTDQLIPRLCNADQSIQSIGNASEFDIRTTKKDTVFEIPFPDYDEYFETLYRSCESQTALDQLVSLHVSLPVEGSRGCFAKCDFCQIPGITSKFATKSGSEVAERVINLTSRYKKDEVVFADAVCNTWAESYADLLISCNKKIAGFMELRVHQAENFWTKLAVSGINEIQLGIESVSPPLLKAMNKGTSVIKNLRAAKYVCELGIKSSSNLIVFHPKSTLFDVAETRRVLELTRHFPPVALSAFAVSYGSPYYMSLSENQKKELVRGFDWLPAEFHPYTFIHDLSYPLPKECLPPDVNEAWIEFCNWHSALKKTGSVLVSHAKKSNENYLKITDSRSGKDKNYKLPGDEALLYDFLHNGVTIQQCVTATHFSEKSIVNMINKFLNSGLVVETEGFYLALAIRSRQELINNLTTNKYNSKAYDHHFAKTNRSTSDIF